MYFNKESIVLASGSPRRQQYLEDLGIGFTVYSVPIDETPFKGEGADLFAVRMAREKAEVVSNQFHRSWVIGGDTVVCLDGEILGKPLDNEDAFSMLMSLSGKEHIVRTGIFLCHAEKKIYDQRIVETKVVFADFDESIARGYVNTGECLDITVGDRQQRCERQRNVHGDHASRLDLLFGPHDADGRNKCVGPFELGNSLLIFPSRTIDMAQQGISFRERVIIDILLIGLRFANRK